MHHEAFSAYATRTEDDKAIIFGAMETKGGQDWLVETERGKIWLSLMAESCAGIRKVRTRASDNRTVTQEYSSGPTIRLRAKERLDQLAARYNHTL